MLLFTLLFAFVVSVHASPLNLTDVINKRASAIVEENCSLDQAAALRSATADALALVSRPARTCC